MSNVSGGNTGWGAVGAADNVTLHFSGGPDHWHCDGADYVDVPGYPRTRAEATAKLNECRNFAQAMLGDGLSNKNPVYPNCRNAQSGLTWRCEGVAEVAHLMITNGKIDVSQPGTQTAVSGCSFNGVKGRIKCLIIQQFGYALHAIEDFFSHSNFTDQSPAGPFSAQNPPGVGGSAPLAYWDLTQKTAPAIPSNALSTGCFPDSKCEADGRTNHETLNKDKGQINSPTGNTGSTFLLNGSASAPKTVRGQQDGNFRNAVTAAIRQVRATWQQLQVLIKNKEGESRGKKIICAIASDTPNEC